MARNHSVHPFKKGVLEGHGCFGVGCADFMTRSSADQKGCLFRLYFPTEISNKDPKKFPTWLPSPEYGKGYASTSNVPGISLAAKLLGSGIKIPAVWHAPLLPSSAKSPVVVLSHGLTACRTAYSTICIELASRGFIVAAVEHRDESACVSFTLNGDNGSTAGKINVQWIPYRKAGFDDFELRNKQVKQRASECKVALDILTELHDGKEVENVMPEKYDFTQLKGRLDLDRVAVCGHSFGGGTSIASLALDPRFKCSVVLDAWLFPLSEDVYDKVTQPILFINTETFQWRENIKRILRLMPEGDETRKMITIRGTNHMNQCDISLIMGLKMSKFLKFRGPLRPDVAYEINNRALLAFLWKHLGLAAEEDWEHVYQEESEHVILGTNVSMEPEAVPAKH